MTDRLSLAQWRMAFFELYSSLREISRNDPVRACEIFRAQRDRLFANHVQSPLTSPQQKIFRGLNYFAYDDRFRTLGSLDQDIEMETKDLNLGVDGLLRYTRIARIDFTLLDKPYSLDLYWIEGYGGGLFLPFRDLSNGKGTYSAGRYLFDTIKGANIGIDSNSINLDFNFAYNPSCAYNNQWICPLPPMENEVSTPIEAGEKSFLD
jgi:uncharacterized protein (DUF1684 family)